MQNLQELMAARDAAFQAWKACPDRKRAEKARLEAALGAAWKAYTAAKKAAEAEKEAAEAATKSPQPSLVEVVRDIERRNAARRAEVALEKKLQAAHRLYQMASDWPRCGQDWPADRREREADALLRAHGFDII